jgi:hypothetical protein
MNFLQTQKIESLFKEPALIHEMVKEKLPNGAEN